MVINNIDRGGRYQTRSGLEACLRRHDAKRDHWHGVVRLSRDNLRATAWTVLGRNIDGRSEWDIISTMAPVSAGINN